MWRSTAPTSRSQVLTVLLVCTSSLAGWVAISEPFTPWYWPAGVIAAYLVGSLALAAFDRRDGWFSRSNGTSFEITPFGLWAGALLLAIPFVEGFGRVLFDVAFRPLEQTTLIALVNFAFYATAMSRIHRSITTAVWISFILLISAVMLGDHTGIVPLAAAYGGFSLIWLADRHWRSTAESVGDTIVGRVPVTPIICLALVLAGLTAASTRLGEGMPRHWAEWSPSSGGSRWSNPAAFLGVGDGDWVVSGANATSTGSVDSEYYLESDRPSLYDVMIEAYGEPRPPDQITRAISVSQEFLLEKRGHKAPDAGSGGRQFSLYRQTRPQHRKPDPQDMNALIFAEGRMPLHLSATVYGRFDGVNWHEPPVLPRVCAFESRDESSSWLWLPEARVSEVAGGTRQHDIRFNKLSAEQLALPSHVERFRLGKYTGSAVNRWARDVLKWAHDGVLRPRCALPSGTTFTLVSHALDKPVLFERDDLVGCGADAGVWVEIPDALRASADSLAANLADMPRGWGQVQAVMDHLQTHCEHDHDRVLPADCEDPVHHFLHHARGGPAYQFATAAALTLRSLGYPTRVVSGFYVDRDDYVANAGHAPVHVDDAHFWIEVRTVHGDWITFDPTPGFDPAWYQPTFADRTRAFASAALGGLVASPVLSLAGLFVSLGLWWKRLWVRERMLTGWCLWWPFWRSETHIAETLRLLDLRSEICGRQRPSSSTPLAWYDSADQPACRTYLRCLYAASYGSNSAASNKSAVADACRAAVREVGRDRLRRRLEVA